MDNYESIIETGIDPSRDTTADEEGFFLAESASGDAALTIESYGFDRGFWKLSDRETPARITAVHKQRYEIVSAAGHGFATLKSSVYYNNCTEAYPTAGDFVGIDPNPSGDSRITRTLPRRTVFERLDPSSSGHAQQSVAANFDYVFVMSSLNQNFNVKRIERYITLAWQSGATPVVVLTKADLVDDCSRQLEELESVAIGVDTFTVSSTTGAGVGRLRDFLGSGRTAVFLGSSGVGKSSLVNALAGREIMAVSAIREQDARGRHTTTHRQLVRLDSGLMIIDTPGMRELGMWDVTEGLGRSFADVEQFLGRCRFSDCRHVSEPGCAIKAALESGELAPDRWQRYLALRKEARYSEDREGYMQEQKEFFKSIRKTNRQSKKVIGH